MRAALWDATELTLPSGDPSLEMHVAADLNYFPGVSMTRSLLLISPDGSEQPDPVSGVP